MSWQTKVHPELRRRVEQLLKNLSALGLDVRVVQSLRTFEEQDALFRKRPKVTNARGGQSNHNYGLAVDLCPFNAEGKPDWNNTPAFKTIGREAKKLGLEWGGDWKFVDMPHVQLRGLSIKECFALYQKGGLPRVWARMYEILGGAPPAGFIPEKDDLLEYGDSGAEIESLQKQLAEIGLLRPHEIDGRFGKITRNAVIAFQRQNKLTADGIVGPGTKARLDQAIAAKRKASLPPVTAGEIDTSFSRVRKEPAPPARLTNEPPAASPDVEKPPAVPDAPPIRQTAENITNVQTGDKTVPDNFVPETKELAAPAKENSTETATKMTIAGFAVPTFLVVIIQTGKDLIGQGFVNTQQLGDIALTFIRENTRYVFYLLGLIIVGLILKKAWKQLSFLLQIYVNGRGDMNNVQIVPSDQSEKKLTFRQRITGRI